MGKSSAVDAVSSSSSSASKTIEKKKTFKITCKDCSYSFTSTRSTATKCWGDADGDEERERRQQKCFRLSLIRFLRKTSEELHNINEQIGDVSNTIESLRRD